MSNIKAVPPAGIDARHNFREDLDARYRTPLMNYFLKRTHSAGEAEDLTQEVFVRLMSHVEGLAPETANGYVFTVAANLLRDRDRRGAARQDRAHRSLDDPKSADVGVALVEEIGPERVLLARESLQEALTALAELDERTRDMFILFRLERMRQRDIAALYGLTVSAVEKQLLKAARHLTKRLKLL